MTVRAIRLGVACYAAQYLNRDDCWTTAHDARGHVIRCESRELAHSVAMYRRDRLEPFRQSWNWSTK